MKRGTPEHPKTKKLARLLKIPIWGAVGLLEMLWHFTAEFTPQGDIGRYSNQDIADGIQWKRNPSVLIDALVSAKWLDAVSDSWVTPGSPVSDCQVTHNSLQGHPGVTPRLLVHDWSDHADQAVRKKLEYHKLPFLSPDILRRASGVPPPSRARSAFLPEPEPEPEAPGALSLKGGGPNTKPKPNGNGWHPDVERFLAEYPGDIKPDKDARLYISYVTSADLEAVLFKNLAKWKGSDQWQRGFIPTSSKWLEDGQWKVPPKAIPKASDHPDFLPNY